MLFNPNQLLKVSIWHSLYFPFDYKKINEFLSCNKIIFQLLLERMKKEENSKQILSYADTVKLLTYNLFLRPPGIKTNQDDYKNQRFQKIKSAMLDFDIICFQQVFSAGNFRKQAIVQYGIFNKFYYWGMSDAPAFYSGPPVDGGLCVLSKYPIIHSVFESYNVGVLSDSASDKGSLYCKIQLKDNILHLFNTHLQATYHNFDDPFTKKMTIITRLYQFEMLAKRIQDTLGNQGYKEGDLVLVAGDLNTDARKTYYDFPFDEAPQFSKKYNINPKQFNEYSIMKTILKNEGKNNIRDLAYQKYQSHPITFGAGQQKVLTGYEDISSKQRLDYIIQIIPGHKAPSKIVPNVESCKIQKFLVSGQIFTQLSDHFGLSIDLCM